MDNVEIGQKMNTAQEAYMQHWHLPILNWGLIAEEPSSDIVSQLLNTTLIASTAFLSYGNYRCFSEFVGCVPNYRTN